MVEGSPISDIIAMRQQGLSNNQIIQNLQRQGYNNTQIFDSMNQADTKMAVEGQPSVLQPVSETFSKLPEPDPMQSSDVKDIFQDQVKVEELVETIIEEKWVELVKDVNKIIDWKNRVDTKLAEMETNLSNVKDRLTELNQSVLGKIDEYDNHIMEVGSNVKAMEKVFSKVLPTFTDNVNELSRIATKIKGGQDEKKES